MPKYHAVAGGFFKNSRVVALPVNLLSREAGAKYQSGNHKPLNSVLGLIPLSKPYKVIILSFLS